MTANLVAFETVEDLLRLTGLSRNELWAYGFNLDDWDIGFQSDINLYQYEESFWWLIDRMEDYYVGVTITNYRGEYYYLVHHA